MKTLYLSDLDGTLLDGNKCISRFTIDVINDFIDRGGLFSFATARSEESSTPIVKELPINVPPIFYNGAVIGYAHGETPPTRIFFSDDIKEIINELTVNDISPIVYSFINGEEKFSFLRDKCTSIKKFVDERKHNKRFRSAKTFFELTQGNIFYITCIDNKDKLRPFYEKYRDSYYCVFQKDLYSGEQWLEIMPKTSTKANAASTLKNMLGCDELVVFGDGKNDIEFFKAADRRYAVSNAVSELKEIATSVIGSNDNDGVALFLQSEIK